jgi:nucleoid DNA-binding protein
MTFAKQRGFGSGSAAPLPRHSISPFFLMIPFLTAEPARVYTRGVHSELRPEPEAQNVMTKRDLILRISEETGLVQQQVLDIVQRTLDYIAEAVSKGRKVELRNFGVFEVKVRKARVGRNPNKPGTDVPIPQRAVVKFKPGKEMRETVLKLTLKEIKEARALDQGRSSGL